MAHYVRWHPSVSADRWANGNITGRYWGSEPGGGELGVLKPFPPKRDSWLSLVWTQGSGAGGLDQTTPPPQPPSPETSSIINHTESEKWAFQAHCVHCMCVCVCLSVCACVCMYVSMSVCLVLIQTYPINWKRKQSGRVLSPPCKCVGLGPRWGLWGLDPHSISHIMKSDTLEVLHKPYSPGSLIGWLGWSLGRPEELNGNAGILNATAGRGNGMHE